MRQAKIVKKAISLLFIKPPSVDIQRFFDLNELKINSCFVLSNFDAKINLNREKKLNL
jgi:hypothetical protein